MRTTPELPTWIREAEVSGYINAHDLCPGEPRLYGTESLYGDWNARVLLLAKDFAPASYVRDRVAPGDHRPYSHKPGLRTNKRLAEFVVRFLSVPVLYGSALANLLRDDGEWSGTLPNRRAALDHGARVLRDFVLPHLPDETLVMCLGEEAWECACAATGLSGDWREHRDAVRPLGRLVAAFHPVARVSVAQHEGPWQLLADLLGGAEMASGSAA
jgi:hypothetical protein